MAWMTIADLKGLGITNPRVVGDDLVVDLMDGNMLQEADVVVGSVRGPQGPASDLDFTVTALAPGAEPTLAVTGTPGDYALTIGLPTGPELVAEAVAVAPGDEPTAEFGGAWPTRTLTIGVPEGVQGEVGPPAQMDVQVTTLPAGAQATATVSGTAPNFTLELGVPRGDTGSATAAFDDDVVSSETGWSSRRIQASDQAMVGVIQSMQTQVDGKSDVGHTHSTADLTSGTLSADRLNRATVAAAEAGTDHIQVMTPLRTAQSIAALAPAPPTASTTLAGVVELATTGEAVTGTLANRAVTPAGLSAFEAAVRPERDIAVFVGASNVVRNTWTTMVCAHFGWTEENYAIGGTGFMTGQENWRWRAQADNVYSDFVGGSKSGLRDRVGYVFVAGGGVDAINENVDIGAEADYVYERLKSAFPNARLITVPGLWRHIPVRPTIIDVSMRMRQAAMRAGWEVIWHGWEWLYGRPALMEADEAHPNAAGYQVFADHIIQGLHGLDSSLTSMSGWNQGGAWKGSPTSVTVFSSGGTTYLRGYAVRSPVAPSAALELIGQVTSAPQRPSFQSIPFAVLAGGQQTTGFVETGGMTRVQVPSGVNWVSFSTSWPVGR